MASHRNFLVSVLSDAAIVFFFAAGGQAASDGEAEGAPKHMGGGMMGEGLMMPSMDPVRRRELFASKGCVVCHSVNGVGGEDATAFDASTMPRLMNPFEFSARMWRGAKAMIYLQQEELGEQIELTGQDLADIIAFVHHATEQAKFSGDDIPPNIKRMMHHMGEEAHEGPDEEHEEVEGAHGDEEKHD